MLQVCALYNIRNFQSGSLLTHLAARNGCISLVYPSNALFPLFAPQKLPFLRDGPIGYMHSIGCKCLGVLHLDESMENTFVCLLFISTQRATKKAAAESPLSGSKFGAPGLRKSAGTATGTSNSDCQGLDGQLSWDASLARGERCKPDFEKLLLCFHSSLPTLDYRCES